ncbi:MAG: translocation/assembly module TamB domain-containing protein, partial [Opitutaceae bacterium]
AAGEPVPGKSVPPLGVTLRGRGDETAFTLEVMDAKLPGIAVRLSEPVTVERSGKFRESKAQFTIGVDLAEQPWFTSTGTVTGAARWVSQPGEAPKVEFDLAAREVAAGDWAAKLIEARGQFEWPRLRVTAGTLVGTAGEQLTWQGGWDFAARGILDGHAEGGIRRATLARWVPAEVQFDAITLRADAAGAWPNLIHSGQAEAAGVVFGALKPLGMALTWAGRGPAIESFTAEAMAGTTKISAAGALGAEEVRLTQLVLAQGGETRLALKGTAAIRWRPAVTVESLHLAGPGAALDATLVWGPAGRVDLGATNISSTWFSELGVLGGPAWQLTSLAAKGAWERGPMTFSMEGTGAIQLGEGKQAVVRAKAQGDAGGVKVEELSVVEAEQRVIKATGRVPLRIFPAEQRRVALAADGALEVDITTEPNAGFWREWAALTGLDLQEPEAMAHVSGTWARPKGEVSVKAARVAMDAARFKRPMPQVQSLDLKVTGDADEVRLERLNVRIAGQELRARGKLPVAEGKWGELFSSPVALARSKAEGRIEIPDAEVAALAPFLPLFVAPKGWLQADVAYRDGNLSGEVSLYAAATRPLGPLGVLQDVNAQIALAGNKIELRTVSAVSGGENVTLSGTVTWPALAEWKAGTAEELKFAVALKGDNLPFVRNAGVLVRGDLDLTLTSPESGTPVLAGTVRLRRSLFLSDIRALLPGRARSKAQTPPYFAVEAQPYDAWRIKIGVEGEGFMTVRTALFNGVASARIQLQGTLGEPLMRGEATIDEGAVRLPFATFAVQEGRVSLQPEQGIEPQLTMVGTARRLGYDLRMEATGPASHPTVIFSSSPPLEPGQVLLMVMAGESPRAEVGFSDRQRASRLGTFLGQSLLSRLGGDSDAGERLTIGTGENVSRQGRETYEIEYRLDDRWSLTAEYDEFDDLNAGVKWRVFSKGGTREEKKK